MISNAAPQKTIELSSIPATICPFPKRETNTSINVTTAKRINPLKTNFFACSYDCSAMIYNFWLSNF